MMTPPDQLSMERIVALTYLAAQVYHPDRHGHDRDQGGIGCEG